MTQPPTQPQTQSPPLLTLRSTADPKTPRTPSRLVHLLLTIPGGLIALACLPVYLVQYYLQRPRVPLRTWLATSIIRTLSHLVTQLPHAETNKTRWSIYKTTGEAAEGISTILVTVPPAPDSLLGAYAAAPPGSGITPLPMPGYMMNGDGPASRGESIVLYFHGGGYLRGHPLWTPFPSHIAKDLNVRVFAGQYRKCMTPDTAFPGPLIDALSAWHYVTGELGFPASRVVIAGDSAGGHLCLALARQLNALNLPLPGGVALMCPWSDFTASFPSWKENSGDYLTKTKAMNFVASIVRFYTPQTVAGPFFSPAFAPAGHWSFMRMPVLVSLGTAEVFRDEIEALISGMQRDGVAVDVQRVSSLESR